MNSPIWDKGRGMGALIAWVYVLGQMQHHRGRDTSFMDSPTRIILNTDGAVPQRKRYWIVRHHTFIKG